MYLQQDASLIPKLPLLWARLAVVQVVMVSMYVCGALCSIKNVVFFLHMTLRTEDRGYQECTLLVYKCMIPTNIVTLN